MGNKRDLVKVVMSDISGWLCWVLSNTFSMKNTLKEFVGKESSRKKDKAYCFCAVSRFSDFSNRLVRA